MLKIIHENQEVRYILSEKERVSLASPDAVRFVEEKIKNIDAYVDKNIDFFTGKEVKDENIWYFNVNKDGKMYTCIYDNEHEPESAIEKEAKYFLMWRHGDNYSYVETIGDYIEEGKIYKAEDEEGYDDCKGYLQNKHRYKSESFEKIELNGLNKDSIRRYFIR